MVANILSIVVGIGAVVAALNDVFQSVIVPRAVGKRWRVSFVVWRGIWRLWPDLAWKLYPRNDSGREDFLAVFAPFTLVLLLGIWASLIIVGYGFIFWGLRGGLAPPVHSLGEAIYFAGTSALTVGFGDIVGKTAGTRLFSVVAAMTGLGIFSVVTAYLFALFGWFQTREQFVVIVGARAGTPPSGVNLLCIAGYSETRDDLDRVLIDAQRWVAQLMESHLAYPVLSFFRSSHDYESWVGTLGTLLDASTLLMTTVAGSRNGQARLFYNLGRHAAGDLSHYYRLGAGDKAPGVERQEFERACDRLQSAGYALAEREEAWKRFAELRSTYAGHLNAMAQWFAIPPLQWVGDRGAIKTVPHA
ncbi:MAG: two pore domain potassium channel family protein [Candidatus Eremiobacteraeota bacterium]|nr:two pore domain potassium channel family protein [Candidatus Eremiobacteraeota bacterium]